MELLKSAYNSTQQPLNHQFIFQRKIEPINGIKDAFVERLYLPQIKKLQGLSVRAWTNDYTLDNNNKVPDFSKAVVGTVSVSLENSLFLFLNEENVKIQNFFSPDSKNIKWYQYPYLIKQNSYFKIVYRDLNYQHPNLKSHTLEVCFIFEKI